MTRPNAKRADSLVVRVRAATSGDRAQAAARPGLGAVDWDKVHPLFALDPFRSPRFFQRPPPLEHFFAWRLQRALRQSASERAHTARSWFSRHVASQLICSLVMLGSQPPDDPPRKPDGARHVGSAAGALPGKPKPVAGAVMPVDRIAALEEYQRAMQECLLAPA